MMILLYILLLTLPFVDHGFFGREIAGLTIEKLIGAACLVSALVYLPRRREFPQVFATPQAKAFGLYVAIAVTSYCVTTETFNYKDFIGIFFSQFLFFIIVMILVDSRERLQNVVLAVIASMGLVSLYLIREWVANAPVYGFSYRPGWVAGDPNMFSASALVVLPLMLHPEVMARRAWQRIAILGCLAVTLISFLLAASRGGFLGLFCMFLVQCRRWSHRFIAIAVCVVIIVCCLLAPSSPLDRLLKPSASDIESSNIRLQLWSVSGKIFKDHPVFGIGLFNFSKYMHRYLPPNVELDFVVPHNTFMEAAVELGIVGLAVFLALFGFSAIGLAGLRTAAASIGDIYYATLTNALISGLVGFGVAAMFISAKHSKLFWFAVFLSACLPPLLTDAVRESQAREAQPEPVAVPIAQPEAGAAQEQSEPVRVGNWMMHN